MGGKLSGSTGVYVQELADDRALTHVAMGKTRMVIVPRVHADKLHDVEKFAGHASRGGDPEVSHDKIFAYLVVGWAYQNQAELDADKFAHMIECDYETRDATDADLEKALAQVRRCYCERCLDSEMHSPKERSALTQKTPRELVELLNLRKLIADANKIPVDGHPTHETAIDKLLETTDAPKP